jgi:hypothetical protein
LKHHPKEDIGQNGKAYPAEEEQEAHACTGEFEGILPMLKRFPEGNASGASIVLMRPVAQQNRLLYLWYGSGRK